MGKPEGRIVGIDALRGLAIMMVVAAHAIAHSSMQPTPSPGSIAFFGGWLEPDAVNNIPYNVIASVYMPLFAFVSGLAQGRHGYTVSWRQLGSRFRSLMIPYIAWLLIAQILSFKTTVSDPTATLRSVGLAMIDPRAGSLWFLYALFMVYAVHALLSPVIRRSPSAIVGAIIAVSCVALWGSTNILGARDILWLYPFFLLGILEMNTGILRSKCVFR